MYKISAPIMASTVTRENRSKYVKLCREAGIGRVFLCTNSPIFPLDPLLGENIAYFKAEGFEVGIWTDTIGHGAALTHIADTADTSKYQPIVNLLGVTVPYTNCPSDPEFRAFIAKHIAKLAKLGPDIVMLDDDFRLSNHGGSELCCACEKHMARICELAGESITREELRPFVISGKPNKFRDAFISSQGESLKKMAEEIRTEVDKESPEVTVCFCSLLAHFDVDGLDVSGVTRLLAGKNKPILRLTGAPYWAVKQRTYSLPTAMEIARSLAAMVKDEGFDTMAEGDVYPRPRYTCPASYLELYDGVMRADGNYSGILKYMFDYTAGPDFETGYLKFHSDSKPFFEKLSEFFPVGANAGVRIHLYPNTTKSADLDLSKTTPNYVRPMNGAMLTSCGIPTVYSGDGVCNSVFGESARKYELSNLAGGTLIDSVAAVILNGRGVDVGLDEISAHEEKTVNFVSTDDPEFKSYVKSGEARVLGAKLKENAEVLIYSAENGKNVPLAYRYENERGERFIVLLFDAYSVPHSTSGLISNRVLSTVLARELTWVARKPLPAVCSGNPDLYLICEKGEDYLSVGLFNCFADYVLDTEILLDGEYSKIECADCDAIIEGNKVILKSRLHGFGAAAFRVFK